MEIYNFRIKEVLQNLSKVDDFDVIFPSTSLHLDHRHAKEELMKLDFQETASHSTIQTYPSFCQSELVLIYFTELNKFIPITMLRGSNNKGSFLFRTTSYRLTNRSSSKFQVNF